MRRRRSPLVAAWGAMWCIAAVGGGEAAPPGSAMAASTRIEGQGVYPSAGSVLRGGYMPASGQLHGLTGHDLAHHGGPEESLRAAGAGGDGGAGRRHTQGITARPVNVHLPRSKFASKIPRGSVARSSEPEARSLEDVEEAFLNGENINKIVECDRCHMMQGAAYGLARLSDGHWVGRLCSVCVKKELARPSGPWAPYRFTKRCFVCRARAAFGTERSTDAAPPKEQESEKGRKVGNFGLGRAMHCAKHKRAGEVDVVTRRCTRSGCFRTAIFGLPGGRAVHCSEHKENESIDLKNPRCIADGCSKQPSYGDVILGIKEMCANHRKGNHVDLKNRARRCRHPNGCVKISIFGLQNGKAHYCGDHREAYHVDVVHDRCRHPEGCMRQPSFGDAEEGIAKYCIAHKHANHTDVKSSMCRFADVDTNVGCSRRASFGSTVEGIPMYCSVHKKMDHVDLVHKLDAALKVAQTPRLLPNRTTTAPAASLPAPAPPYLHNHVVMVQP